MPSTMQPAYFHAAERAGDGHGVVLSWLDEEAWKIVRETQIGAGIGLATVSMDP
jgi:hypothetical protein